MTWIRNLWLFFIPVLFLPVGSAKAQFILSEIFPSEISPSEELAQRSTQPSEEISRVSTIAEQVVSALAAQQYEEVRSSLSPDLREAITAQDIQQQWQQLLERRGSFIRIVSNRPTWVFDGYIVLVTVAFERGTEDLMVLFNDQQQIVGFDILQLNDNIQAIAEEFVDALAAGDYALARRNFHPTLKTQVFPADLEQEWQAVQAANGQFQQRLSSQVRPGINADVVQVSIEFENATGDILIAFKGGRIAGFDFPQAPTP